MADFSIRPVLFRDVDAARREMLAIGVDPGGVRIMAPKALHYNLRVDGLTCGQANIIKQEMLSAGGEAAVAKGAASCSVEFTDAVLSGTQRQFGILIEKLKLQWFDLPRLAAALEEAISRLSLAEYALKAGPRSWTIGYRPLVMGILNVTPDSFYAGSRFPDPAAAVERARAMLEEGADLIDVGGESTRPGSSPVAAEEELGRVVPVVKALASIGAAVSIDTRKAGVARAALEAGAVMVNDVSALGDGDMAEAVRFHGAAVVLMHMRGAPADMQKDTSYADLAGEVYGLLRTRIEYAASMGVEADRMVIDPGIGFGKSREGNYELIRGLGTFKALGRPILVGLSRKSFLGNGPEDRLPATLALTGAAVANGASIIRAHDVKETRAAVDAAAALKTGTAGEKPWEKLFGKSFSRGPPPGGPDLSVQNFL